MLLRVRVPGLFPSLRLLQGRARGPCGHCGAVALRVWSHQQFRAPSLLVVSREESLRRIGATHGRGAAQVIVGVQALWHNVHLQQHFLSPLLPLQSRNFVVLMSAQLRVFSLFLEKPEGGSLLLSAKRCCRSRWVWFIHSGSWGTLAFRSRGLFGCIVFSSSPGDL